MKGSDIRADGASALAPSRLMKAYVWVRLHPKAAFAIAAVAIVAASALAFLASPGEAEGAIPLVVVGIGAVLGAIGIGAVANSIEDILRTIVNACLSLCQTMIGSLADADGLLKSFDELIKEAYPLLQNIHQVAVIPLANVVIAVFLVVGLVKVMQTMGQNDAGVDLWQIVMVFLFAAFALIVIDNSWAIMVGLYELSTDFIGDILNSGSLDGSFAVKEVDDDVKNAGILAVMALVSIGSVVVTFFVVTITHVVIIIRAIQLYVYTCFAPLPLACMVSDSSRSIATNFLKAYVALLMTGAILAVLIVMFSFIAGNITVEVTPDSPEAAVQWCVELALNLVYLIASGWAFLQSGNWARDFVGMIG